jgi:hypothetical protein
MNWYQLDCFIGGQQTLKSEVFSRCLNLDYVSDAGLIASRGK